MANSADIRFLLRIAGYFKNAVDLGEVRNDIDKVIESRFTNGTGSGQANEFWHDTRTVNASANEDLDLAGALTSVINGATLTFTKIKAILIVAASGNTNAVRVTRPASNGVPLFLAAGDGIDLPAGAVFFASFPAGVTVTASTGDLINVENSSSGTSVTYDIYILGTV